MGAEGDIIKEVQRKNFIVIVGDVSAPRQAFFLIGSNKVNTPGLAKRLGGLQNQTSVPIKGFGKV